MFESDDFDQVLSQFDFPGVCSNTESKNDLINVNNNKTSNSYKSPGNFQNRDTNNVPAIPEQSIEAIVPRNVNTESSKDVFVSPKHVKRKIINTHFDHKAKRRFPGPAGLLTGTLEEDRDENIELLSQDIEHSQNNLRRDLFESALWLRLVDDVKSWDISKIDPIKIIKEQALSGNLRRRKAQTVTAFVETVDRSATDPLIILRDSTGTIKCTLHRDAWSTFSPYIVSEYCALVLWKPTILTTGSAFKKHYLNITLSNIYAIYSAAILKEDERNLPSGYSTICEENFTVIKVDNVPNSLGGNSAPNSSLNDASELLDGLDDMFSDDLF